MLALVETLARLAPRAVASLPAHLRPQGDEMLRETAKLQGALERFDGEVAPLLERLKRLEQLASN